MRSTTAPSHGFWVIAVALLLWNLIGLAMFVLQLRMTPETIAALPDEQRVVYEAAPGWIDIAFGVAVIGGVLGAVALLLRSVLALPLFVASLVGLLVQFGSVYALTPAFAASGLGGLVLPVVLVVIAAWQVAYVRGARRRGWLRARDG